jgi:integrase
LTKLIKTVTKKGFDKKTKMNLTNTNIPVNNWPHEQTSTWEPLKLSEMSQIHIRSRQKCQFCKKRFDYFKPGKDGLICPEHGTRPTNYFIDFCVKGERFYFYSLRSWADAMEKALEIKHEIKNRTFRVENYRGTRKHTKKTYHIDRIIEEYIEDRKDTVSWDGENEDGIAPSYWPKVKQHLREFAAWCIKNNLADIRVIKTYEVRQYFQKYLAKTHENYRTGKKEKANGAKTRKNKQASIAKFFKDIRRWYSSRFVPDPPEFDPIKTNDPETKSISRPDQDKILSKIPPEHRPFYEFLFDNGIRPAEARALKHQHITWDATNPYITIQASFSENKYRTIIKTKTRFYVPISPRTNDILEKIPRSMQTDFVFYWIDKRDKSRHKPYMEGMVTKIWNKAVEDAGLDQVRCYDGTRHSAITQWLEAGMSEDDASALVGHRCRSTIKKYDHSKRIERLLKAKMDNK